MTIGSNGVETRGYEGDMDMLYFFDRELLEPDVALLHNSGAGLEYP